jgi:hypothetical protein
MKPNRYFSIQRFFYLFRNDLLINNKTYLFAILGLSIAIYAITFLIMRTNGGGFNRQNDYIPLILIYLTVIGALIGTAFPALNNQIKSSNYLLAPGSTFEKYMVQFIIRIVLFIPIALVIFWIGTHLAKASLISDARFNIDPSRIADFQFSTMFDKVPTFRDKFMIVISIFSLASLLFAGSAYFNRFALVKTIIVFSLIVGALLLSLVLFSHLFYPDQTHGFDIKLKVYKITEDLYNTQLAIYLIGGLSWLFFLPLAYFKLKEKEV